MKPAQNHNTQIPSGASPRGDEPVGQGQMTIGQTIEAIRAVLKRFGTGEWISIAYIYGQLALHPRKYRVPTTWSLPRFRDFERICVAMFRTRKDRGVRLVQGEKKDV